MAISAGPLFPCNPSVSFIINFDPLFFGYTPDAETAARALLDRIWKRLSDGGKVLMELGTYPFSKRYGWVQDAYGISWQLMLTDPEGDPRPTIIPSLLFSGIYYGKAEEASQFYLSIFPHSQPGALYHYPDSSKAVMFADIKLKDTWLAMMDNAADQGFRFNEAISFIVNCDDQKEMDYFWEKLSAVPAAEQCGWIKDKYGLSWQIVPAALEEMVNQGTPEQIDRIVRVMMPMKKLELATIQSAWHQ